MKKQLLSSMGLLKSVFFLTWMMMSGAVVLAGNTQDRQFTGSGTVDDPDGCGSPTPLDICRLAIHGEIEGQGIGRGDLNVELSILFQNAMDNGTVNDTEVGFCAPASGTLEFSQANRDTVTATLAGWVCRVPTDVEPVPQIFNGSFFVTGGTSNLAGVRGTGRITFSMDEVGKSLLLIQGVF
jgi:hypothetical protein